MQKNENPLDCHGYYCHLQTSLFKPTLIVMMKMTTAILFAKAKGYVAAIPEVRNGPRIGLLKRSGNFLLPESSSIK